MSTRELDGRRVLSDRRVLIASVVGAGVCSLVYELLISTTTSYFLGNSVRQFSVTIGLYLASMGLGSYLSRLLHERLLYAFITVELLLGLAGGLCIPVLYATYAYGISGAFWPVAVLLIILIGTLTGLEIPLLTRIMDGHYTLDVNLSNVLSFDYFASLLATLAFPFVLLPVLGTFRSSLVLGILNVGVGVLNLRWFADLIPPRPRRLTYAGSALITLALGILLLFARPLLGQWSNSLYEDRVIYAEQTRYQRIVMTRYREDVRLFLDGNLQFSSRDERRYHEPLVHIPLSQAETIENVLILGGGDGLAVREVLKYEKVEHVAIVDLDPTMFRLARTHPALTEMNGHSLDDPRVRTLAQDAFVFLEETAQTFDVIIADLPDPNNVSLARLYSRAFYRLVASRLAPGGVFVTQATSPYFSQKAFWCIVRTIRAAGFSHVYPYHATVPSFGEWGFVLAAGVPLQPAETPLQVPTQYLNSATVETLFAFPKDLLPDDTEEIHYNTLDRPRVLTYYLNGWQYWN